MAPENPDHLDDRKAEVLRAIVEHYVQSASPVGSQTIVATAGLGVSAATVRNDMVALERDGYVTHPHTSAGRIPTDKGYRFFVDHFAGASKLSSPQRREVADFFASTTRVMDDLLHDTSQLLARVTHHAAVVIGPQTEVATVRSVQLVGIQPRVVLAVVVLSNGVVEKETVVLETDATDDEIAAASQLLQQGSVGRPFTDVRVADSAGPSERSIAAERLASRAAEVLAQHVQSSTGPVFVGGTSRLAAEREDFTSPAQIARLLELLEQQVVVVAMLRELLGPGLTVRIGSENEHQDLAECSLVLAPYLVEGQAAGTIGVLGPTRMDYRQAQAAVTAISNQLSRTLPS
jgi:heat-inducible transcriptional repressor